MGSLISLTGFFKEEAPEVPDKILDSLTIEPSSEPTTSTSSLDVEVSTFSDSLDDMIIIDESIAKMADDFVNDVTPYIIAKASTDVESKVAHSQSRQVTILDESEDFGKDTTDADVITYIMSEVVNNRLQSEDRSYIDIYTDVDSAENRLIRTEFETEVTRRLKSKDTELEYTKNVNRTTDNTVGYAAGIIESAITSVVDSIVGQANRLVDYAVGKAVSYVSQKTEPVKKLLNKLNNLDNVLIGAIEDGQFTVASVPVYEKRGIQYRRAMDQALMSYIHPSEQGDEKVPNKDESVYNVTSTGTDGTGYSFSQGGRSNEMTTRKTEYTDFFNYAKIYDGLRTLFFNTNFNWIIKLEAPEELVEQGLPDLCKIIGISDSRYLPIISYNISESAIGEMDISYVGDSIRIPYNYKRPNSISLTLADVSGTGYSYTQGRNRVSNTVGYDSALRIFKEKYIDYVKSNNRYNDLCVLDYRMAYYKLTLYRYCSEFPVEMDPNDPNADKYTPSKLDKRDTEVTYYVVPTIGVTDTGANTKAPITDTLTFNIVGIE